MHQIPHASCCQSRRRRQHVMPDPQPNSWGNICHGIPLRSTKRMPVRQARSGMRGRPPFGRGSGTGRSGCNEIHQLHRATARRPYAADITVLHGMRRCCHLDRFCYTL